MSGISLGVPSSTIAPSKDTRWEQEVAAQVNFHPRAAHSAGLLRFKRRQAVSDYAVRRESLSNKI